VNVVSLFELPEPVYKPVAEGEKVKAVVRDAYMRATHGHAPAGLTCGTCALFVRGVRETKKEVITEDGSVVKERVPTGACQMYTGGPSAAWKEGAQACALWELKEEE
jgi:hypothetical protein